MKQSVLLYDPSIATQFVSEQEKGPGGGPALKAYLCPAKVPTIGFGHTRGVKLGDVITRNEAYELLTQDLFQTQEDLAVLVKVPVTENQFIALMSFVFNFGLTKCRTYRLFGMINRGETENIKTWWPKYCNPGSKFEDGLKKRRMRELELFLS